MDKRIDGLEDRLKEIAKPNISKSHRNTGNWVHYIESINSRHEESTNV